MTPKPQYQRLYTTNRLYLSYFLVFYGLCSSSSLTLWGYDAEENDINRYIQMATTMRFTSSLFEGLTEGLSVTY